MFGKQMCEKIIADDVNSPLYVKEAAGMGFANVNHMCDRISGAWQQKLHISAKKKPAHPVVEGITSETDR